MEQTCKNDEVQQSQPDSLNYFYLEKHSTLLRFQRCSDVNFMLDAEWFYFWKLNLVSSVGPSSPGAQDRYSF